MKKMKFKRIYYWGLLGIVPGFGTLAGVIMVITGLFYYKDKRFTFIGFITIMLSVISLFSLFNYLSSDPETQRTLAGISKKNINGLVEDIESYKYEKGEYPDSLEQVFRFKKNAIIFDVLLTTKLKKNNQYNYQKISDKYKVFSSGIDSIPNTDDDIYPDVINYSDSVAYKYLKK